MTNKDAYFCSFISLFIVVFAGDVYITHFGLNKMWGGNIPFFTIVFFIGLPTLLKFKSNRFNNWLESKCDITNRIYYTYIKYRMRAFKYDFQLAGFLIKKGFKEADGTPIKCCHCGSESIRHEITDRIDFTVTEKEAICNKCNSRIGYWGYGYWEC